MLSILNYLSHTVFSVTFNVLTSVFSLFRQVSLIYSSTPFVHIIISRFLHVLYSELFQKFRKEDKQLSGTEAYMRRSNSLQRVSSCPLSCEDAVPNATTVFKYNNVLENKFSESILFTRLWLNCGYHLC